MPPEPKQDYNVVIHLTRTQYELASECQKQYEEIFNQYISLEEVFINSLFFTNNINHHKLAILSNDKEVTKCYPLNKGVVKHDPLNNIRKKRKIPLQTVHSNQATLGGFP
jgi:hypothetical protein